MGAGGCAILRAMSDLTRREILALLPAAWLSGCKSSEPISAPASEERRAKLVLPATPSVDGAGVHLRRSLGSRSLPMLDPFLLLDEIHSDKLEDFVAGFPTHPHRGFETVTYMIGGVMEHRDSLGNHGALGPGSAQWMTAGSGIVHSEMPRRDSSSFWGLQLWVNLPKKHKLTNPRYQDIVPGLIPEVSLGGSKVRVIAGEVEGTRGPVEGIVTAPEMLDVLLRSGEGFSRRIESGKNAFLYVLQGAVGIGSTRAGAGEIAVLGAGANVSVRSDGDSRFLLLAAHPIGEPVARSGPFVMNTQAEIQQAWEDYRNGVLVRG